MSIDFLRALESPKRHQLCLHSGEWRPLVKSAREVLVSVSFLLGRAAITA